MNTNNQVRSEIEKLAKRLKCSVRIDQDHQFLYISTGSAFYEKVFVPASLEHFRTFCDIMHEYDCTFFPAPHDMIGIGSLDILDIKRKQEAPVSSSVKIKYSEEDVLS